jgi:hypothetical protein
VRGDRRARRIRAGRSAAATSVARWNIFAETFRDATAARAEALDRCGARPGLPELEREHVAFSTLAIEPESYAGADAAISQGSQGHRAALRTHARLYPLEIPKHREDENPNFLGRRISRPSSDASLRRERIERITGGGFRPA